MNVLAISHQRDAGPGVFADAVAAAGASLDLWHVAEEPSPPRTPHEYDAVMTFGGSMHVDQADRHAWIAAELEVLRDLLARGTPLMAVCLGAQLLAQASGGAAPRASRPEIGWFDVEVTAEGMQDPVFAPLAPAFEAFEWHSYECVVPAEAAILARSPVCVQAYRIANAWAIQFHAEVSETDAAAWIRDYASDEDAVRTGVDPDRLAAATEARIGAFNDLGRALCGRWLDAAGG